MNEKPMSNSENWQKMLKEQRLQHQLEIQSRQIERVFTHHRMSAQVAGGNVQSRSISFDLQSQWEAGIERLRELKQDLLAALGVSDVSLTRENGQLRLQIVRPEDPPVSLLDLMPLLPELPPVTAVLGIAEDGHPLLLSFSENDINHILLAGEKAAGKTSLLRTLATSLALSNKQSQLQMIIIDPDSNGAETQRELEPLTFLPHLLAPVVHHELEAIEIIEFLVEEMAYRLAQGTTTPAIVVLVDRAASLLETAGEELPDAVTQLAQRGAEAGIHLVLSTSRPESATLTNLLKANLPIRIVGQVGDENRASAAAEISHTQAEYLLGQGDFLAVVDETMTHFQAAYIGNYDLHLTLETVHRTRPRPLLAQPLRLRPSPDTNEDDSEEAPYFWVNEEAAAARQPVFDADEYDEDPVESELETDSQSQEDDENLKEVSE